MRYSGMFNRFNVLFAAIISISIAQQKTFATPCPCDIYAAGGTPCVAAHSTVRALYSSYNGPLYQVRRTSDNKTLDIGTLTSGGIANATAQDTFLNGKPGTISKIYDQSPRGNHLPVTPPRHTARRLVIERRQGIECDRCQDNHKRLHCLRGLLY